MNDILDRLRRPFPVNQLKWRQGPGGKRLVYLDARQYQSRLDEVMGLDWQCRYSHVTEGGVVCDVGLKIEGEWVWRSDGAGKTDIEGEKGQFSDAFKRACTRFGIGKYLYTGFDEHDVPDWATPEGYDRILESRPTEDEIRVYQDAITNEDAVALYDLCNEMSGSKVTALQNSWDKELKITTKMKQKHKDMMEVGRADANERAAEELDREHIQNHGGAMFAEKRK